LQERRVALVTGSTGSLGTAICYELAAAGFDLALHCRGAHGLMKAQQLALELSHYGGIYLPVTAELPDAGQIARMFAEIKETFGRLDVLVNNAGVNRDQLLIRMGQEEFEQVLDVNLKAAFLCLQHGAKMMIRQRYGRIINIASVAGQLGTYGQANYAASKAALIGLTKTAARELASRQITVNAVAPGFIDAGLTSSLTPEQRESFIAQIPLGRPGSPRDVALAVGFLAGDKADYITGQVLNVNGGLLMP